MRSQTIMYRRFTNFDVLSLFGAFRRKSGVMVAAGLVGVAGMSAATDLPSGTGATLHEVLVDQVETETWVRFRFVSPQINRTRIEAPAFEDLEHDFPHLCATLALPFLETHGLEADTVVISIADRIMDFGVSDPDATQYFEQFRVDGGSCVWEGF